MHFRKIATRKWHVFQAWAYHVFYKSGQVPPGVAMIARGVEFKHATDVEG